MSWTEAEKGMGCLYPRPPLLLCHPTGSHSLYHNSTLHSRAYCCPPPTEPFLSFGPGYTFICAQAAKNYKDNGHLSGELLRLPKEIRTEREKQAELPTAVSTSCLSLSLLPLWCQLGGGRVCKHR